MTCSYLNDFTCIASCFVDFFKIIKKYMKNNLKNKTKERFKTVTFDMSIFDSFYTDDQLIQKLEKSEKSWSFWLNEFEKRLNKLS